MVEKMNGVKYWVLIGSAVILSACANTGVVPEMAPEPVVTEPVTEEPVIAEPPAPVEAEMLEPGSQESLDADAGNGLVYFAYDRYDLSSSARSSLQSQAEWLQTNGVVKVIVEGHADERGTREYNLALGDRRANSVKNYLVALGVDPSRINTVSYGKERPVVSGSGESVWALNRRGYTRVN